MIYFIQARGHKKSPVKIGFTADPDLRNRISGLQTGNPYPLHVVGVIASGTAAQEHDLHFRFSADRLEGEWFRCTAELVNFIRKYAAGYVWGTERPKQLPPPNPAAPKYCPPKFEIPERETRISTRLLPPDQRPESNEDRLRRLGFIN